MTDYLPSIGLKQIRKMVPVNDGILMGDEFFILDVKYSDSLQFLKYPFRGDAYVAIFCKSGSVDVEVNLMGYHVQENTLFISTPGNILRLKDIRSEDLSRMDFVVLAISKEFLSSINFDFKKLFDERLTLIANPCVSLDEREISFCSKYIVLLKEVMETGISNKEEAVRSLIASLFYVLAGFMEKNFVRLLDGTVSPASETRLKLLFEHFMSLVSEYHTRERGLAFYAGRLGLTPKYLSKLIRQVSGRSAPDWIDSFVILEAKNLLKYSDESVKEIVYKLNFPNPSVFYKFFKSHTGMTPSDYRNGRFA